MKVEEVVRLSPPLIKCRKHGCRRAGVAAAVLLAAASAAAPVWSWAEVQAEWVAPVNGNWTDPANWSTNPNYPNNGLPGSGDTYSAAIAAAGGPYTVTLNAGSAPAGLVQVDRLLLNGPAATVVATGGVFQATQGLQVNDGMFRLEGLTLRNTTVSGSGGNFWAGRGTLDNVTLRRLMLIPYDATGELYVRNGLHLDGGTAATGGSGTVRFTGTQPIDGTGTFHLAGGAFYMTGGTLTITTDVTLRGSGQITPYSGGRIVNNGTIRAIDAFSPLVIRGETAANPLVNHGLIEAGPGALLSVERAFDNASGVIRANGGLVQIGEGSTNAIPYTTAQVGRLEAVNGGRFWFGGPLNNSNATLTATPTTGNLELGGTITGGTLATTGDAEFFVVRSSPQLVNLKLAGRLTVRPTVYYNGGIIDLSNVTLDGGTIALRGLDEGSGANAFVYTRGNQSIGGSGEIVFEGRGERGAIRAYGGMLDIGPGVTIRTDSGGGSISGATTEGMPPGAVRNRGTISSQTLGQTIRLNGLRNEGRLEARNGGTLLAESVSNGGTIASDRAQLRFTGTWTNAGGTIQAVNNSDVELFSIPADFGSVAVTDSVLALAGGTTFRTSQFADRISYTRSTLAVRPEAVLDNSGATLPLAGYDLRLQGGTIHGGTVAPGPGGGQILGGNGTLSAVRAAVPVLVSGSPRVIDLQLANTQVSVEAGVPSFNGTLSGTGEVVFNVDGESGGQTSFNNLTVAAGVTVRTGASSGTFGLASDNGSLTNRGTFSSAAAGKTLTVNGTVTNEGLFEAKNGGVLRVVRPSLVGGTLRGGTWAVYEGSVMDLGPGTAVSTNSANVILSGPGSVLDAVSAMHTNAGRFTLAGGRDFDSAARRGLTNAGTLSLGSASDLHAASFAQEPAGVLRVELSGGGGDEAAGHLLVDGAASLHGLLEVSLAGGFVPRFGDEFEVLAAGLVSGRFAGVTTSGLDPGAGHFEPVYAERRVGVRFVEGAGGSSLNVPEPTSLAALPALACLLARRRRRRRKRQSPGEIEICARA